MCIKLDFEICHVNRYKHSYIIRLIEFCFQDDLLLELEELEQEDLDSQLLEVGTELPSVPVSLPEVPSAAVSGSFIYYLIYYW